jgi:hypothetical protein
VHSTVFPDKEYDFMLNGCCLENNHEHDEKPPTTRGRFGSSWDRAGSWLKEALRAALKEPNRTDFMPRLRVAANAQTGPAYAAI